MALTTQLASVADTSADPVVLELAETWSAAADRIDIVVEAAGDLSAELRARPRADVLCHSDAHVANVLIDDDDQIWLIDWDGAVLAPRERDLMFVVDGVIPDAPVRPHEQSWFFEAYGRADIDVRRLAYYRCSCALQDLADFGRRVVDDGLTKPDRTHALSMIDGLLSSTGIVALAMQSLADIGH